MAAIDIVVARAAVDRIVAGVAVDRIGPAQARNRVAVGRAVDPVRAFAPGDGETLARRAVGGVEIAAREAGRDRVLQRQQRRPAVAAAVLVALQQGIRARLDEPQEAAVERIGARAQAGEIDRAEPDDVAPDPGLEVRDDIRDVAPAEGVEQVVDIAARATGEGIDAALVADIFEIVRARAARLAVRALVIIEGVVAITAAQRVGACIAIQRVLAVAAVEAVSAVVTA